LGRFGNELYAADLSEVVVIDINTGKVKNKIAIDSAKALNDITVDDKGVVYVSDSKTKKIHRIENGRVTTFLTNVRRCKRAQSYRYRSLYTGWAKIYEIR
jgi:streptogramin lyase